MRRPATAVVVGAVAVALAVLTVAPTVQGALPTHANEVEADSQVSADGTVLVESVLQVDDGFVVVHRDGADGPGEAIGHVLTGSSYYVQSVRVSVDDPAWTEWGDNRTVWVALHRDEGDSGFDPDEDPIATSFGNITAERIQLGKGDNETSVVAEGFSAQQTPTNDVRIRRVALDRDGLVVVRPETPDGDGPVVGATALAAGVHRNVTVSVDGSVFASRGRRLTFVAQLYAGDGPTLDDGDRPIQVGGDVVSTEFIVERTGPVNASATSTDTVGTRTTTLTPTTPSVVTPSPTPTPPVVTPTPAPSETPTPEPARTTGTAAADPEGTGTGASGPGFGEGTAAVAVVASVGALLLGRRLR